ncbi:MAG: putative membrane protein insertion efficiency factor [Bermanella sp.]|jgi:putative membrane protein insertion efficiency factor
MRSILIALVRAYRYLISPLMASHCRFYPSCSVYALDALEQHGSLRGSALALKRIARCHPFNPGGYDPVPESETCKEALCKHSHDATQPTQAHSS